MKSVYLAGGFKTRWQDQVTESAPYFNYIDPSLHGIEDPVLYTEWDLKGVKRSDIVFANMEGSNPGGYAMAMEVGYAKALGKVIIYCESNVNSELSRRFDMIRAGSDYSFFTLTDAIEKLKNMK